MLRPELFLMACRMNTIQYMMSLKKLTIQCVELRKTLGGHYLGTSQLAFSTAVTILFETVRARCRTTTVKIILVVRLCVLTEQQLHVQVICAGNRLLYCRMLVNIKSVTSRPSPY